MTDFMAKMIKSKIGERAADFACGTGGFLTSALKELDLQVHTKDSIKSNFPIELRSPETADLFMNAIMARLKFKGHAAVVLPDGFYLVLTMQKWL